MAQSASKDKSKPRSERPFADDYETRPAAALYGAEYASRLAEHCSDSMARQHLLIAAGALHDARSRLERVGQCGRGLS